MNMLIQKVRGRRGILGKAKIYGISINNTYGYITLLF